MLLGWHESWLTGQYIEFIQYWNEWKILIFQKGFVNSPTFITVDLQAVSLLIDTLCSRTVINNACIDESTKKTYRLSISKKAQHIDSYANKVNKLFFRKTQLEQHINSPLQLCASIPFILEFTQMNVYVLGLWSIGQKITSHANYKHSFIAHCWFSFILNSIRWIKSK